MSDRGTFVTLTRIIFTLGLTCLFLEPNIVLLATDARLADRITLSHPAMLRI